MEKIEARAAWRRARAHCIEWGVLSGVMFFVVGGVIGYSWGYTWTTAITSGVTGGLLMLTIAWMGASEEWERWRALGLFY